MNEEIDPRFSAHYTGLRAIFLVAMHHGVQIGPDKLAEADFSDTTGSLLRILREAEIQARILSHRNWADITSLGSAYPVMAQHAAGNWVIVIQILTNPDGQTVLAVLDPRGEQSGIALVQRADFERDWNGMVLLAKRKYRLTDEAQPFGLRWFMPEIIRNGRYFRDVAVAAIMSTLIGFATPLFFNVMIDKVVPHHSYQTLYAVILIFALVTVFDGIFSYVRQNLMLFATNKIDARLLSRTFEHLLRLPMHFFESTTAGVLIRHMQQAESVRNFLTGRLFNTLLDLVALPLLLVGLFIYSPKLTVLVLAFSALIALIIGVMIPTFRRELERLYQAEGARQADLVETIHGIRAVKSLALEPLRKASWNSKVVNTIRRRTTVGRISFIAVVLTNGIEKFAQIAILGIGAVDVFDGAMTIGALVAFNMLSGRVSGPLVQMVGLINEYQQTALSLKMLGTVMDHPPERGTAQAGIRPLVTGQMEFSNITFKYDGSPTPALDRISFKVEEGQMIGIVGRSGSGKTTVTRLIQGIQTPQDGLIRLNGTDIRHVDLSHLRRSIGVVLQDNILFRGTIRDNIAAAKPAATLIEVMEAARLAGAAEFIDRLPMSYDTLVEESATNFSGGQRQRLAIARALITQPRLLIFDEATSALDPDSEVILQQNLAEIGRGRTMVIVSHRLSSLVKADAILVLEQGAMVDFASHSVLLGRCDIYRHLWHQQTQFVR